MSGNRNRNSSYKTSMEQSSELHEAQVILTDTLATVLGAFYVITMAMMGVNLFWDVSTWIEEVKVTVYLLTFVPPAIGVILLIILKKND